MFRERGMTLVELLIAMVLLGLIMTALGAAVRLASLAWERGAARADAVQEASLAQAWLRRQLSQARPVLLAPKEDGTQELAYRGEADRLELLASLGAQHGGGLYALALDLDRDSQRLRLRYQPFYPGAAELPAAEQGEDLTLLEGVAQLAITYYEAAPEGQGEWHSEWHERDRLPARVRIRLIATGGEPWPDLVVAPRMAFAADTERRP